MSLWLRIATLGVLVQSCILAQRSSVDSTVTSKKPTQFRLENICVEAQTQLRRDEMSALVKTALSELARLRHIPLQETNLVSAAECNVDDFALIIALPSLRHYRNELEDDRHFSRPTIHCAAKQSCGANYGLLVESQANEAGLSLFFNPFVDWSLEALSGSRTSDENLSNIALSGAQKEFQTQVYAPNLALYPILLLGLDQALAQGQVAQLSYTDATVPRSASLPGLSPEQPTEQYCALKTASPFCH